MVSNQRVKTQHHTENTTLIVGEETSTIGPNTHDSTSLFDISQIFPPEVSTKICWMLSLSHFLIVIVYYL